MEEGEEEVGCVQQQQHHIFKCNWTEIDKD